MPATRSRSSTEAAEVATEEVKQVVDETKEVVDAPVVPEVVPSEAEAVPAEAEAVPAESSVPVVAEDVPVAPVVETNGTSEAVPETNGNGVADAVEPAVEAEVTEKRKSEVGGEGDGPDSTDAAAVPVKKAKVDDESVSAEEAVPVVEASG